MAVIWGKVIHARFADVHPAPSLLAGPCSSLPASGSLLSASDSPPSPRRILVYRIGQLGDTIVALPAMWAVRRAYPDALLALLCDRHPKTGYVQASDLLKGAGLFDDYLGYPVEPSLTGSLVAAARLLVKLRSARFDTVVYLAPTNRSRRQIERDRAFFRLAGIRRMVGMNGCYRLQKKQPGRWLDPAPRETELLMRRIRDFVKAEDAQNLCFSLALNSGEELAVQRWLALSEDDRGRNWVAVGPGSKMPSKRWPADRFSAVILDLIRNLDLWPVVFGGPEDAALAEQLLRGWNRGHNAAGKLGVREAAQAIQRCVLYVGNDTGTMHLAAAVNVPCVAIFSARERPGLWYPRGENNRILRATIDCEGCALTQCLARGNECLNRITAPEVTRACRELVVSKIGPPAVSKEISTGWRGLQPAIKPE